MRRPVLLRILTAVWAFWFAAAFLELPGAHVCAVHGATVATAGSHAHHHEKAPTEKGEQCSCLGHCSVTSSAVISSPAAVTPSVVTETPRVVFDAATIIVTARPHDRPFANGPPVA